MRMSQSPFRIGDHRRRDHRPKPKLAKLQFSADRDNGPAVSQETKDTAGTRIVSSGAHTPMPHSV